MLRTACPSRHFCQLHALCFRQLSALMFFWLDPPDRVRGRLQNQKIKARPKSADPTLWRRGNFKLATLRQEVSLVRLLRYVSEPPILLRPVARKRWFRRLWNHPAWDLAP